MEVYQEIYHQMTLDEYMQAKEDIRQRLKNMAEDYICIGYRLRQIQKTEGYRQDGYSTLAEFAKAEYGLSESNTSRFMEINRQFSVDGFSDRLVPELEGYGSSKLTEMLNLSTQDRELVTKGTTIATIREMKKLNRTEEMIQADVVEEADRKEIPEQSELGKAIIEFFRKEKELLNTVWNMTDDPEAVAESVNPSGNRAFRSGLYMLFFYGYGEGVALKIFRKPNQKFSWKEFTEEIDRVYRGCGDAPWEKFYDEKTSGTDKDKPSGEFTSLATSQVAEETAESPAKTSPPDDSEQEGQISKAAEEMAESPVKDSSSDDLEKEGKLPGQREMKEYFDDAGNYHIPEEREEDEKKAGTEPTDAVEGNTEQMKEEAAAVPEKRNAQEGQRETLPRITVEQSGNTVKYIEDGVCIQQEECIDLLGGLILQVIGQMMGRGCTAEIRFKEKGDATC